jgi:hypothetical protein
MKPSAKASNDSNAAVSRILSELDDAIKKLPLEKMVESVKFPNGDRSSSVHVLEHVAEDRLQLLAVHARMGSEEAILALRNLGNIVARELEYLAGLASNDAEDKSTSISPQKESIDLGGASPAVIRLRGNFSSVNEILARESDVISSSSFESNRNQLSPDSSFARQAVVDVMNELCWPESIFEIIHHDFHADSVYSGHPDAKLERAEQIIKQHATIPDSDRSGMISHLVIRDIIRKKIERIMPEYFRNKTIENFELVRSESLTWPISTSAFKDDRNELEKKIQRLSLGNALPFRLGAKGKGGANRKFESGSYVAFALEYCLALHQVRRAESVNSDNPFADIQTVESSLSNGMATHGPDPLKGGSPPAAQTLPEETMDWTEQARRLPPFPVSRTTLSKTDKLAIKAWQQAAMARAETVCRGDWDGYTLWPKCVKDRAGFDGKDRFRSVKEAVNEKLREGIEKLQPNE